MAIASLESDASPLIYVNNNVSGSLRITLSSTLSHEELDFDRFALLRLSQRFGALTGDPWA